MIGILAGMPSVLQAFLATLFTWGMRAAGAALVFGAKKVNRKLLDAMLAFAAGVMIAASFWSLLAPAIDLAERGPLPAVVPPLVGFLLGGVFIRGLDLVLPHLHPGHPISDAEGIETSWRRSVLLVSAITLHNIPEGLAIGLQNFPEGTAVSMPSRREGMSRGRSFFYGQLSATVEPVAAVIGAAAVVLAQPILPYALAAGAMIFVVAEELIPEAERGSPDKAALALMVGFAVMMTLDVSLG